MALETFSRTYSPMLGKGPVLSYFAQTGLDALKGADILSTALDNYTSSVKYGSDDVAQYMRNIVQTNLANLGTRILYTTAPYNSFDTHAGELAKHTRLWTQTVQASVPSTMISKSTMPATSGALCVHRIRPARA